MVKNKDPQAVCSGHGKIISEIPYRNSKILWLSMIFYFVLHTPGCVSTAQQECNWPCFHGADRTNKSTETGLMKKWPEAGPELLFTISGLGEGYSSVSIAEGYLFTSGLIDKQTYVFAFDLKGNQIWKKPNGQAWETTLSWATTYTGSRSTPTYDDGVVYHLGETGRLAAFNYKTGDEIWSLDLPDRFNAEIPEYGYCESVIIDGDRLFCNPGGKKGYTICLDKKNGNLIWANTEIQETVGNSSSVIFEYGGYRQIAGLTSKSIFSMDSETGKLLWIMEYKNSNENNIADPIFYEGYIFAASGYGKGSTLIKLNVSGSKIIPETVWQTELMDNLHGGVILHNGYLYGSGHNNRGWCCLDFMTGKEMWKSSGIGSLTFADGMLYCLDEKGIMTLVTATPEKYDAVSTFQVPSGGKGMHWAHPVICGGRLYIRHTDKLFVYDVRGK
jgi:outer membrane protein assembly factor BamB